MCIKQKGQASAYTKEECLLKQPKLTYTFHDLNPPDVLWKVLVDLAAKTAVKTVELRLKEMEEGSLDKISSVKKP